MSVPDIIATVFAWLLFGGLIVGISFCDPPQWLKQLGTEGKAVVGVLAFALTPLFVLALLCYGVFALFRGAAVGVGQILALRRRIPEARVVEREP